MMMTSISKLRSQLVASAMLLSVGLAVVAQRLLDQRRLIGVAIGLYLVAAILFAFAGRSQYIAQDHRPRLSLIRLRGKYLIWALVFGGLSLASFGRNRVTLQAALPWTLGVILCFVALPGPAADPLGIRWRRVWEALRRGVWRIPWRAWGLLVALIVGAYLRFYRLAELPADLGWDLPYNYFDAQRVLNGELWVFYPDNMGREGMFFYLIAAVAKLIGLGPYTMRLASALVGIAAIPAIYLLARECADCETAVWAALLLAVNKWHIVLTRSGYRVSLMPLFSILALYGLARGLRRGAPRDWAWCGLFLGLGLWTYKAFTFAWPTVVAVVAVYLLLNLWPKRGEGSGPEPSVNIIWSARPGAAIAGLGLALLVAVIVAMPMIRFILDSPDVYATRELHGVQLVADSLGQGGGQLQLYARSLLKGLQMFHYEGDGNSRFGVPYQRHFGLVSAALLALGAAWALARLRQRGHALLWMSALGLMVPMVVSMLPREAPNCFRSSGVIGPALVLAALPFTQLRCALAPWVERGVGWLARLMNIERLRCLEWALVPLILAGALWGAEAREAGRFYFRDFARITPSVANYSLAQELAETMIAFHEGAAYIKVWPHWYDGRAVSVHLGAAGRSELVELFEVAPDQPPLSYVRGKILVLLHPEDIQSLETLKAAFPRWTIKVDHYPDGQLSFIAFYGER